MEQVAFRLDQSMIDAVEERIERDGITLSAFMRQAVRKALIGDPGLPLATLKVIALSEAEPEQVEAFRARFEAAVDGAFQAFLGSRTEPALNGAPAGAPEADWLLVVNVSIAGKPIPFLPTSPSSAATNL